MLIIEITLTVFFVMHLSLTYSCMNQRYGLCCNMRRWYFCHLGLSFCGAWRLTLFSDLMNHSCYLIFVRNGYRNEFQMRRKTYHTCFMLLQLLLWSVAIVELLFASDAVKWAALLRLTSFSQLLMNHCETDLFMLFLIPYLWSNLEHLVCKSRK